MGKMLALCYMGFLFCLVLTPVAASSQEFQIEKAQKKVVLTGYTRGIKKMTLTAEVTGRVTSVNYDIGSTVGKVPFITIDPTFIDFEIEATHHAQKKTRARHRKNHGQDRLSEKGISPDRFIAPRGPGNGSEKGCGL